jgi:hypothetical protein
MSEATVKSRQRRLEISRRLSPTDIARQNGKAARAARENLQVSAAADAAFVVYLLLSVGYHLRLIS